MKNAILVMGVVFGMSQIAAGESPTDWPQWRGPLRDGKSRETGLLKKWPDDGPTVVWKVGHLGEGYSSLAIQAGRIYTQGNLDGEGHVLCLKAEDGSVVWKSHPPVEREQYKHQKGNGARGTPTVDGDRVYAIGGGGDLTCFKADSGEVVWSKHLSKDFGGSRPGWGYCESPLIDGDHLIVTPGGSEGCVVALNKRTGETIWRSTDVMDKAHYCSAIVVESHGVRQIVQFTGGGGKKGRNRRNNRATRNQTEKETSGSDSEKNSADKLNGDNSKGDKSESSESGDESAPGARVVGLDATTGHLLWSYDKPANGTANVATPIFQDDSVFASSAYGTGGGLVRLAKTDKGFVTNEAYFEKKMANHHGGIVLVDGYLYGFGNGGLICQNFTTGEIVWQARSVSKGSLVYADGCLYCYGEKNEMALVEANPKEYVELGRFHTKRGDYPTWAHPVVAGGRLYLRDMETLTCYDISANSSSSAK